MGYNKSIRSGNQFELYEYEKECVARGRPRGYRYHSEREMLHDGGEASFRERVFLRRKDNARRSSMAFRRIILSNLTTIENPLLFTITFKENRQSLSDCAKYFHLFTINLRNIYGKGFRYIAVPEFQERGAVHYHALFWGIENKRELLQERLSGYYQNVSPFLSDLFGQGFVFLKDTDGHAKLSSYLAKYMVKAICDSRLFSTKAYFASRNILRPVINKGFPSYWVQDEYHVDDISPLFESKYSTSWLGDGRYRLFML